MNGRLGAVQSLTRTAHLAPQLLADSGNNTFGGIALVTDLCKQARPLSSHCCLCCACILSIRCTILFASSQSVIILFFLQYFYNINILTYCLFSKISTQSMSNQTKYSDVIVKFSFITHQNHTDSVLKFRFLYLYNTSSFFNIHGLLCMCPNFNIRGKRTVH